MDSIVIFLASWIKIIKYKLQAAVSQLMPQASTMSSKYQMQHFESLQCGTDCSSCCGQIALFYWPLEYIFFSLSSAENLFLTVCWLLKGFSQCMKHVELPMWGKKKQVEYFLKIGTIVSDRNNLKKTRSTVRFRQASCLGYFWVLLLLYLFCVF